jgi:hypothetical protein
MIAITNGAPINDVMELIGRLPSNPGNRAMRLQKRANEAPIITDDGNSILWSADLVILRAR